MFLYLAARGIEWGDVAEQLAAADECFLTGTAAEVIPVTKLSGQPIGDGCIGPVTTKLQAAFREFIQSGEELAYAVP